MRFGPEHLEELKREHKKAQDIQVSKWKDSPEFALAVLAFTGYGISREYAEGMLEQVWNLGFIRGAAENTKNLMDFLERHNVQT